MEQEIDFKKIWQQQNILHLDVELLYKKLRIDKRKGVFKIIVSNIVLIMTFGGLLWCWFTYKPQLTSTKTGIVLVMVAMVVFILSYNKLLPLFNKMDCSLSAKDFVSVLKEVKSRQQYIHTKAIGLYFVLLSIGITLYMYEHVSKMTYSRGVIAYGITILWVLFNWFFLRPRIVKKQQGHINELIDKFENIQKQLETSNF